jgi:kynurenine formamidase
MRGPVRIIVMLAAGLFGATARPAIDDSKIIDLTHPFDERTIYWPTAKPFEWTRESWGRNAAGNWYTAGRYAASEHGGTHLDAPIHFAEGRETVDQVAVARLVGPALVIDVSAAATKDRDYRLTVADIAAWEARRGRIPGKSIVLVRTGWERHWGNRKAYLGTDTPGDTANLHFPGLSRAAAELLAQRKVDGVGLDTPSLDYGPSKDFPAHRALAAANVFGLENVANLARLPATGATVIALPMKIKGGTGGPTRIIAILP